MKHLSLKGLRADTSTRVARHPALPVTYADAADLAQKLSPEAPVFCFSAAALEHRAERFHKGFPGEVAYAVKCNPGEEVLRTLAGAGITVFDVASVHEMQAVRRVAPRASFHYHNPVKSRAEIAAAHQLYGCVRFAVDDAQEIAKIADVLPGVSGIEIAVRFRLPRLGGSSAHDFSSKFGATREEAVGLLQETAARGFKPVLTFHPGSQCTDPTAYVRHIEAAAKIAAQAGVQLAALNVGGGFPSAYKVEGVPPLEDFFAAIDAAATDAFGAGNRPALECEPGRGLVATSTALLTRVKLVKDGRGEVFLNDGIYGALMEVYQVPDLVPPHRVLRNGEVLGGPTRAFTVYGPTCDPLDRLPGSFELPADIREDDYIEFGSVGAYGRATATRFNGYESGGTYPVASVLTL